MVFLQGLAEMRPKPLARLRSPVWCWGEDDIFFIDIGPTWQEWEGDGGQTFVTGEDSEKARCAAD
jgi:hypothetical protein